MATKEKMKTHRKTAIIIGVLFIAAAVFSILALVSYGPILNNPDYMIKGPTSGNQIVLGAIFEMITAVTVAGTAIAFFSILRKHNEMISLGYVGGRLLEAVLIIIGLVSLLTLLALRQEFANGATVDTSSLQTADKLLRSTHAWTFILGPNFMLGINTLMYTSLLYQTKLVPRTLAVMGLVGAVSVFIAATLEMFGVILQISTLGVIMALPVGAYEITLAVYLIVKGFKLSETAIETTKVTVTSGDENGYG
jgi:hypothetical protein